VAQGQRVVELLQDVLGDALLGVYLHGSAVIGGLKPTSDLDLFAVTSRRTTPGEQRALIERLMPISGRGDPSGQSRSIGLEIVARPDVYPWRYPARLDLQYGDWYRPDFAAGNFAPWDPDNPDLAILLAMVLQADHPLLGPPPSKLFGPIPWTDVRRAMLDSIPDLRSYLDGDERNVLLTFLRIWASLATGRFFSKDGAADWAIPSLPAHLRPVGERARDLYLQGIAAEDWGELRPLIGPFVDAVVVEIEALAD
jgi:streptomycin 3"-adenylyltransferase